MKNERQVPAPAPQSGTSKSMEPWKKAAIFISITTSLPLVIIALKALFKYLDDAGGTAETTQPTYSTKLVRHLLRSANTSLNPCSNFYLYTCYNWKTIRGTWKGSFETRVRQQAIQGRLRSPGGRGIFGFYKGCLSTTSDVSTIVHQAVQAVLDLTRNYDPSVPRDALTLLLTLTLHYTLSVPVKVSILTPTSSAEQMHIETPPRIELESMTKFISDHGHEALHLFNVIIETNVTLHELGGVKDTLIFGDGCDGNNSIPNVTDYLIPGISQSDWRRIISELHPWPLPNFTCHSNLSALQNNLAVLMTGNSIRRETRVALLTLQAVAVLTVNHLEAVRDVRARFEFCFKRTSVLELYWVVVTAEELTSPEQHAVIRAIFSSISEAVTSDAASVIDASDLHMLRNHMRGVKLILSEDFVHSGVQAPALVANTFRNEFVLRKLRRWIEANYAEWGVRRVELLRSPFRSTVEFVAPDILLVPPYAYLSLNSDSADDFHINAAVLGLLIARQLWRKILVDWEWSDASYESFERHLECVRRDPTRARPGYWVVFRLALNSVRKALLPSHALGWHKEVYVWSASKLSRSQMFYMNIYFTEYCARNQTKHANIRNDIFRSLRDFRQAFGCPEPQETCFDF